MSLAISVELENNPDYGIVVTSRKISAGLNKRHKHVLRDLDNIVHCSDLSSDHGPDLVRDIIPVTYKAKNNQTYREYLLTKDGFTLYMFNIQGYNDFKWAYIQKFNEMEAALKAQEPCALEEAVKEPVRKTFRGTPVMTTKDIAYFLECPRYNVNYLAKKEQALGTLLEGEHLAAFKRENGIHDSSCRVLIFYEGTAEIILRNHGAYEDNKAFLDAYFEPDHREDLSDNDMRFAIRQADLLYTIAKEIKDPVIKEMNYKAVTALLINIGLWDEHHAGYNGVSADWSINSTEGGNKRDVLMRAKHHWPNNGKING